MTLLKMRASVPPTIATLVALIVGSGVLASPASPASVAATESAVAQATFVARQAPEGVGAGSNAPQYNNGRATWTYRCTTFGNFKVTSAKIHMFSNGGNRVKGFHFKYRVVPSSAGLGSSNWSDNVAVSFPQGTVQTYAMKAGPQGQSWSAQADWSLQIKLKYPRSLRTAYRFKYKKPIINPDCGGCDVVCGREGSHATHATSPARMLPRRWEG